MAKITRHGGPSVRVFEDQAAAGREMRAQRDSEPEPAKVETFDHPAPAPAEPVEPVEDRPPPAKKTTTAKKAAPPAADRPAGDG